MVLAVGLDDENVLVVLDAGEKQVLLDEVDEFGAALGVIFGRQKFGIFGVVFLTGDLMEFAFGFFGGGERGLAELEGLGAFDNVNDRGWKVVCDATNNTASDRDLNQMNVWLFIKPVKVAKYIEIKAIITRSTASFEAVIAAGIV